jgi:hypothetical protein
MTGSGGTSATATEALALPRQVGVSLFLFALALRLPLLPGHLLAEGDGVKYATLARAILAGDASGLANPYWSNFWPAVIAAVAWLTRLDVVTAGRVASLVAGSCLAPATAALTGRTLGRRTGLVAGLLVAGHPWLIHFSTLLFTESLFAFLLVVLLLSAIRRQGVAGAAATGVWAGLALLTRPEAQAAIAAVLLGFLAAGRSKGRAQAARRAAVFLVVVLVFVLGRALVVHRYHGRWDLGGTKATANLFWGLAESDRDKERVRTELNECGENALARKAREENPLAFVFAHPGRVARHVLFNGAALVACSLRVFPFVPLVGGRPPLWWGGWPPVLALWAVALSVVALVGLGWSLRDGGPARLPAATGLLYAAGLAPFTVHDRLVVALAPLFLVFLAHGLVRGVRQLLPNRAWTLWCLAAGAVILGLVSLAALLRAPELDYARDPVVQREAGEWLAARYPQETVLMTAAPCVDFYFHDAAHSGREVSLPWADYPGVVEAARRQEVSLLAIPEWHLQATQHPAADTLLHPETCREELRLLATLGSGSERMFLYELRPRTATR